MYILFLVNNSKIKQSLYQDMYSPTISKMKVIGLLVMKTTCATSQPEHGNYFNLPHTLKQQQHCRAVFVSERPLCFAISLFADCGRHIQTVYVHIGMHVSKNVFISRPLKSCYAGLDKCMQAFKQRNKLLNRWCRQKLNLKRTEIMQRFSVPDAPAFVTYSPVFNPVTAAQMFFCTILRWATQTPCSISCSERYIISLR